MSSQLEHSSSKAGEEASDSIVDSTSRDQQHTTGLHPAAISSHYSQQIVSGPLASPVQTQKLTVILPRSTTSLLGPDGPTTSRKIPIVIPATTRRLPAQPIRRSGWRSFSKTLIGSTLCCVVLLVLATVFVAPLGAAQHSGGIAQALGNIFTSGQINSFDPLQREPSPTMIPTPVPTINIFTTSEGYCGGSDIWGTCATATTRSGVLGTGMMLSPLPGSVITQYFGNPEYQAICQCTRPHSGIDLAANYGTPILAADSGQVIWTGWDWSGLGWAVKISHGHYIATIYGHLSRFIVEVGQNVTKGQVIAYEGSTGASTGPHLHFMVMVNNIWVNPMLYTVLP